MKQYFLFVLLLFTSFYSIAQSTILVEKIKKLNPNTSWQLQKSIPLAFPTFHPQGMVKIGDFFYMSSVEVIKSPKNGDTGEGIGHLFKFDSTGKLNEQIILGERNIYHPGGIDFDGKYIWIPVSEYRPNSKSIIYKVNPKNMETSETMRFDDHIGGIVHNTDSNILFGVSWGSRSFYQWKLNPKMEVQTKIPAIKIKNPSYYIDYQDCHYVDNNQMLCSGFQKYSAPNGTIFRLGGFELINLLDKRPVYQVPIKLWSPSGLAMTNNPFWIEATANGLRTYFVPDDDKASTLFIYEADLP